MYNGIKRELLLLLRLFNNKILFNPRNNREVIDSFHKLFHESKVFLKSKWRGIQTLKSPFDIWVYQEIINDIKPDIIIETGTYKGGSALFMADMLDIIGKGLVITVDIKMSGPPPKHKRIKYITGSSTSAKVTKEIENLVKNKKVMVVLDSDHTKNHVLNELAFYSKFVSKGSYLIIEDTHFNNTVFSDFGSGPGPMEAVNEFLKENNNFVIDKKREKFLMTFNPSGYLLRVK